MSRPRERRAVLGAVMAGVVSCVVAGCGLTSAGKADDVTVGDGVAAPVAVTTKTPTPSPTERRPAAGVPITIAFGGDVHFEGQPGVRLAQNPATALAPVADVLRRADLAVVNLETAVAQGGTPVPDKEYVFRAPPSAFTALREAGVDVASMANDHGMDYGVQGLRDSLAAAKEAGFPIVGIGLNEAHAYAPAIIDVGGQRIAVIGATQVMDDELVADWTAAPGKPGLASAKRADRLVQAVTDARRDSDTVVVFLHWGVGRATCPTETQRTLMRQLADAGADAVIGSHAHVLQGGGWEESGAYVHYGLGNFVFYADGTGPNIESGVLTLTVLGRAVTGAEWAPARIVDGVATPLTGAEATSATEKWNGLRGCAGLAASPPHRIPGRAGRG